MNLQPLFEQLTRLNSNLETWIGLVAAANALPAPEAAPPAAPAAETEATTEKVERRGRPKKMRYWYDNKAQRLEEATDSPGAEFVELTKTKFEEVKAKLAAPAPAPTPPAAPTAAAPSDDPFADDEPGAGTTATMAFAIEDVREVAFKVRDKFGTEAAKTLIAKYAVKLDQIPVSRYGEFVTEATALLQASANDL